MSHSWLYQSLLHKILLSTIPATEGFTSDHHLLKKKKNYKGALSYLTKCRVKYTRSLFCCVLPQSFIRSERLLSRHRGRSSPSIMGCVTQTVRKKLRQADALVCCPCVCTKAHLNLIFKATPEIIRISALISLFLCTFSRNLKVILEKKNWKTPELF